MSTSVVVNAAVGNAPLDPAEAQAAVASAECGAVVGFSGVVRDHDGGQSVRSLSYSAHPTAQRIIEEVALQVAGRHDGVRLWVAHRTGPLAVGDAALVAAVAAPHRGEAFAACTELVDTVKATVPVWKEQFFTDGTVEWVGIEEQGTGSAPADG